MMENKMAAKVLAWRMAIVGRSEKIDPKRWDVGTPEGLKEMVDHWRLMGVMDMQDAIFFKNSNGTGVLDLLAKAHDDTWLNARPAADRAIYRAPFANMDRLHELHGQEGTNFRAAVEFVATVKELAVKQDDARVALTDKKQNKDREPITATIGKAFKDNLGAFQEAVRTGDYTTAGAYILGIWAVYKGYKTLDGKNAEKWRKWMWRGAAVYAAHTFAKNAGFNALEKLGLTDLTAELKDTSLDAMYDFMPEMKNVDPDIVMRMSDTNMGDLYREYQKTSGGDGKLKRRWIDPAQFRDEFDDKKYGYFRGMRPEMAFDQKRTDSKAREYRRVGQELYLLVESLKHVYDKVVGEEEVEGMSFEYAVTKHAIYSKSTVHDFTVMLRSYVIDMKSDTKLAGLKEGTQLQDRLHEVLDSRGIGFESVVASDKDGVFHGKLMGFPVVYLRTTDGIKVVPQHKYAGNPRAAGGHAILTIPYTDEAGTVALESRINGVEQMLQGEMKKRWEIFLRADNQGMSLTEPVWDPQAKEWVGTLKYTARDRLTPGQEEQAVSVYFRPGKDGKGLSIESLDKDVLFYVGDITDPEKLREGFTLAALVRQRGGNGEQDFGALKWFLHNGELHMKDTAQGDSTFEIRMAGVRLGGNDWITVKVDEKGVYSIDPKVEAKLLKDFQFQRGLAEAIGAQEFGDVQEKWEKLIEGADEDYIWHFFKSVPGWFTNMTWDDLDRGIKLKHFSGSIPKNYTIGLVNTQKQAVFSKFMYEVGQVKTLRDVNDVVSKTMVPAAKKMRTAAGEFSKLLEDYERRGKSLSEEEFQAKVLDEMIGMVHQSNDVKSWYKDFMHETFSKYGMDDFRDGRAQKANRILQAYAHHIAPVDKLDIDGANLNFLARFTPDEQRRLEILGQLLRLIEGAVPTLAEAQAKLQGLSQNDYDEAVRNLDGYMKMQNYLMAKQYETQLRNEIAGRVRTSAGGVMSGFNGITSFDSFRENHRNVESFALRDTTPPLKMSNDYVQLHEWLEETDKAKRDAAVKAGLVILPRSAQRLHFVDRTHGGQTFTAKEQMALYTKLLEEHKRGFEKNDTPMTELEARLKKRIMAVAHDIFKRYNGDEKDEPKVKSSFIEDMNTLFSLDFSTTEEEFDMGNGRKTKLHMKVLETGFNRSTKYNKIKEAETIFEPKKMVDRSTGQSSTNMFVAMIKNIETTVGGGNYFKTLTLTDQDEYINREVRRYFNKYVLDPNMAPIYFEEDSLVGDIGEMFTKAKQAIFGF